MVKYTEWLPKFRQSTGQNTKSKELCVKRDGLTGEVFVFLPVKGLR